MSSSKVQAFFDAIATDNNDLVRDMLTKDKDLAKAQLESFRGDVEYEKEVQDDAIKFLGIHIGQITGLQYAIFRHETSLASDIIDLTVNVEDLNIKFGCYKNTALHLATLFGNVEIVAKLLKRGAEKVKNKRGYFPVDLSDDKYLTELFAASSNPGSSLNLQG